MIEITTDDRIVHIHAVLAECHLLLDDLAKALDSVERIFPPPPVSDGMLEVMTGL